jgi:hypothetical protein
MRRIPRFALDAPLVLPEALEDELARESPTARDTLPLAVGT